PAVAGAAAAVAAAHARHRRAARHSAVAVFVAGLRLLPGVWPGVLAERDLHPVRVQPRRGQRVPGAVLRLVDATGLPRLRPGRLAAVAQAAPGVAAAVRPCAAAAAAGNAGAGLSADQGVCAEAQLERGDRAPADAHAAGGALAAAGDRKS